MPSTGHPRALLAAGILIAVGLLAASLSWTHERDASTDLRLTAPHRNVIRTFQPRPDTVRLDHPEIGFLRPTPPPAPPVSSKPAPAESVAPPPPPPPAPAPKADLWSLWTQRLLNLAGALTAMIGVLKGILELAAMLRPARAAPP